MKELTVKSIAKYIMDWHIDYEGMPDAAWCDKDNNRVANASYWNPFQYETHTLTVLNIFEKFMITQENKLYKVKVFYNKKWYEEKGEDFKKVACNCVLKAKGYTTTD